MRLPWISMTEKEWSECEDPKRLFKLIQHRASQRKCVLFAVACHHLPPAYDPSFPESLHKNSEKYKAAVDFADDLIEVAEIRRLWPEQGENRSLPERGREWATSWACQSLWDYEDPFECDVVALVRDVFGYPYRPIFCSPNWRTSAVLALARDIYENRKFDQLTILANVLMDVGCDSNDILTHLRNDGRHCRGCWVLDAILGKH